MSNVPAGIARAINEIDDALAREYMICGGWDGSGATAEIREFSVDQGQRIAKAFGEIEQLADSLPETDTIRRAATRWLVIAQKHWGKADETAAGTTDDPAGLAFAVRSVGKACERLRDHAVPGMVELLADVTVAARPSVPTKEPGASPPTIANREAMAEMFKGMTKKAIAEVRMILEIQNNKDAEGWSLDKWNTELPGVGRTTISETTVYRGLMLLREKNRAERARDRYQKKKPFRDE